MVINKNDIEIGKRLTCLKSCSNYSKWFFIDKEHLRKVEEKEKEKSNKSTHGGVDVHSIMNRAFEMRRKVIEESEEEDGSSEDEWDWSALNQILWSSTMSAIAIKCFGDLLLDVMFTMTTGFLEQEKDVNSEAQTLSYG